MTLNRASVAQWSPWKDARERPTKSPIEMVLPNSGNCFRCGEPGHWADHCPSAIPATSREEHEARIARIIERWHDWENTGMTTHDKQRLIKDENAMWNGAKAK